MFSFVKPRYDMKIRQNTNKKHWIRFGSFFLFPFSVLVLCCVLVQDYYTHTQCLPSPRCRHPAMDWYPTQKGLVGGGGGGELEIL